MMCADLPQTESSDNPPATRRNARSDSVGSSRASNKIFRMIGLASVGERLPCAFQDVNHVPVHLRILNAARTIGNLVLLFFIHFTPDDLLRVADNREIGIVRDHDDLPSPLRFLDAWDN